jgi:AcrR family transcriptional regulator
VPSPPPASKGVRSGGLETRDRLLSTAERLFAERGIAAVSVREILEAAGHRNKNAAQYYFGGREGLITALSNSRSEVLNRRRMVLLDEIEAAGQPTDGRALCRALVQPLSETLDEPGNHFVGFLARYQLDYSRFRLSQSVDPALIESYRRAARLLRAGTGLSDRVFTIRFSLAMDMCIAGLAGRQAQEAAGVPRLPDRGEFVENLIDATWGILSSPATR